MTKHSNVANQLKNELVSGKYEIGDKLQGENVLSERFGVSRQTIRQALGTLEREGLLERRRGSGTYVKAVRTPKKNQTKTVCVMTTYLDDYIFPSIIRGVDKILSDAGYEISLKITRNKLATERSNLLVLKESDICGLIVEGTKTALPNPNMDIYKELGDIPILFINSYYREMEPDRLNYVVVDDNGGAARAVQYLIDHGHTKINGIFKIDDIQGHERFRGFLSAIYEKNLPFDESKVLWYSTEGREKIFSGQNAEALLDRLGDCTAVVCYNDEIALSLMQALRKLGKRVPDDISIISFDDSTLAKVAHPGITTIAHPGMELGKKAADSILKLIENPSDNVQYTFGSKLIVRDSVRNI